MLICKLKGKKRERERVKISNAFAFIVFKALPKLAFSFPLF
jgi:hypothetical protein